jgi:hypothetical protein
MGERNAARAVRERELFWLLSREPAALGIDQRELREWLAQDDD